MTRLRALLAKSGLPPRYERWELTLEPGSEYPSRRAEWAGALVLVDGGRLEVICEAGVARSFDDGAMLPLGCVAVTRLCNRGRRPVRLIAIRRCAAPNEVRSRA